MLNKFKTKYQKMPAPAKAAFWFAICSVFQRGIQFVVVPIYTRVLTTTEYGNYSVFMSWTEILQIFCTLNLFYNSYNVGLTKFDKDNDKFTTSLVGLCTAVTFAVSIVYYAFHNQWNLFFGMSTALCILMFVHMFVKSPYLFWMARERYEYRYKVVLIGTLILAAGTPVLALLSMPLFEDNGYAVIVSKIVIEAALGIPAIYVIFKKSKSVYNKLYWKYGLKNNIPLVPYYLSQIILNHSDRLVINNICGSGEAGIYSVAYSAAMLLTVINTAINNSVIPWKFKKLKNNDTTGIHSVTFSLMALVMAMNAVLIALAPEAMTIMASKAYHDAIWIIPPVACSAYLLFVSQQFINIEFYYEENKFAAYSSIGIAMLNLALNYVFIDAFGYIAAGYTTLFCYLIFTVTHYIAMRRVCKKHLNGVYIWKSKYILLMTIGFLCFSGVMLLCYNGFIVRYAVVLIIMIIAVIKRKSIMGLLKKRK